MRVASSAGRAVAANPVTLAVAGVLVGLAVSSVVFTRLASGKPFEKIAEEANQMILGDLDDEARATRNARDRIKGNDAIMLAVSKEHGANYQVVRIFEQIRQIEREKLLGAQRLRELFPVNSTLDILILRAKALFLKVWKDIGGNELVERVRIALLAVVYAHPILRYVQFYRDIRARLRR